MQNLTPFKHFSVSQLRFLPYFLLGGLLFYFNSATEFDYFLRGYLVLLESQVGLVLIYFIIPRMLKTKKSS